MQDKIMYIELKTGYADNGPAWIGNVQFSKSGRTIYFNGQAFKSLRGQGVSANYYDLETDDEYWISGIKKNMTDRHWAGHGKIMIDRTIVSDYIELVGLTKLDNNKYEVVDIKPTDKQRFAKIENSANENAL